MPLRLTFLLLFVFFCALAQEEQRCMTVQHTLSPGHAKLLRVLDSLPQNKMRTEEVVYTIPVVVHVVYNTSGQYFSYDQVLRQILVLNKDFRRLNSDTTLTPAPFKLMAGDVGIQFALAKQDPLGRPTNGITYTQTTRSSFPYTNEVKFASSGGHDAWDTRHYLNIWVCNMQGALGISESVNPGSAVDGVIIASKAFSTYGSIISPTFNLGRTVTHEIGHWLSLIHIWGDATCGNDEIADTPRQATRTSDALNCPVFPYKPSEDATCNTTSDGRMFSNYMDYTRDACMNIFTQGQANRMRATLTNVRYDILNSNGLTPPFLQDIALEDLIIDSAQLCLENVVPNLPTFHVKNVGSDTITAYVLNYELNGQSFSHSWTGQLLPGADTMWQISEFVPNLEGLNQVKVSVADLQPLGDQYADNNVLSVQFECSEALSVYPVPAFDVLYVKGRNPRVKLLTVYNLIGQEMMRVERPSEVNVSALEEGSYLLILETEENRTRRQIIVLH
jgi:hypothetical protein